MAVPRRGGDRRLILGYGPGPHTCGNPTANLGRTPTRTDLPRIQVGGVAHRDLGGHEGPSVDAMRVRTGNGLCCCRGHLHVEREQDAFFVRLLVSPHEVRVG